MRPFTFNKAKDLPDTMSFNMEDVQLIAGGTNLVDLMKKNIAAPGKLVDISTALSSNITFDKNGVSIGAMVRNSVAAEHPKIISQFPLLSKAILAGASPQIRNMASTGGNILQRTRCPYFYDTTMPCNKRNPGTGCSAIIGEHRMSAVIGYSQQCVAVHPSDMCVALVALDATIEVMERSRKNRTIPFAEFHRLPGNSPSLDNNLEAGSLITAIRIPKNNIQKHSSYLKIRDRDSYAFALISVAAAMHIEKNIILDVRLASGGVAHKPWRWYEAEKFLKGKTATDANFKEAAGIVANEIKPLSKNAFKKPMLQGAVETALKQCMATN